jgi:hypothetical protein
VDETDISRSAETMIRAHGGLAALMCAENAERWHKRGDEQAAELWTRILEAVLNKEAVGNSDAKPSKG